MSGSRDSSGVRNCVGESAEDNARTKPAADAVATVRDTGLMDDQLEAAVEAYLSALRDSDLERVLSLFAADAVVHSPLYGVMAPAEFYRELFADTSEANLRLRSVMHGRDADGVRTVSLWFHFDWRLPSGAPAPFDVVDVARLDDEGKFTSLHIIYDTVDVRPAFEAETGRQSWRQ